MLEKIIHNLFLGEEKFRYLVEFIVFTFFFTLVLVFIIEIWNSVKGSRYLHKYHYEHWKLTKGTIAQRKQAMRNPVVDPIYNKILKRTNKLWGIFLGAWLVISATVALLVVAIDKLR